MPPYNNPRARRWGSILDVWAKKGWQIDVICGKYEQEEIETQPGIRKFAVAYPTPADRNRKKLNQGGGQFPVLRFLYRWLIKSWMWPDQASGFRRKANQKAQELLARQEYDALITVSLPFSVHESGKFIKRLKPDLFWLADSGDPFALQEAHALNNSFLYRKRNRRAEEALLKMADALSFTSSETRQLYLQAFAEAKEEKLHVIPPLSQFLPIQNNGKQPIKLAYFGRFFPGVREPELFLEFLAPLAQLNAWTIHFFGDTSGLLSAALQKNPAYRKYFMQYPLLEEKDLQSALKQTEFLLSLGNKTPWQLPSKTADYLCLGKPIIHLMQGKSDAVKSFFGDLESVICLQPDPNRYKALYDFVEKWEGEHARSEQWKMRAAGLRPEAIAASYASIFPAKDQ